jgi:hypothetical protein
VRIQGVVTETMLPAAVEAGALGRSVEAVAISMVLIFLDD